MGDPRLAVTLHLLRGAVPSAAGQSDAALVGAAQAIVDELAEHANLTPGDIAREMLAGAGVAVQEAVGFVSAAMAVMTPGPHGRCRVRQVEAGEARHG